MQNSFSRAQIERFKREAKQVSRANDVLHSQALDYIAVANGFQNWSLLMKHADHTQGPIVERPPLQFLRSVDEVRQSLRKVPQPADWHTPRREAALRLVEDISEKFVSADNAITFSIDFMESLLAVPRYQIEPETTVYMEMRRWLPYCAHAIDDGLQILLNRHYKPVGQTTDDWAVYEEKTNLHLRLGAAEWKACSYQPQSVGYLFYDGCPPWRSRRNAEQYLKRLNLLRDRLIA